tara:strand:+ start:132 stop:569 length:438 start_codon:yes stop_codon:yes gene_type:complete
MRSFESRTSKNIPNRRDFNNKKGKNFNLRSQILSLNISNKIIDYLNLSLFCLIVIYSFIAFKSQREWTEIYSSMLNIRIINNDLNGYISKTEEYFINKVDMQDQFKKTTSKDIIYLQKPKEKINNRFLFSDFLKGLRDGKYHRGY